MIKKLISGLAVGALVGVVPVIPSSSVSAAVVVTPSKSTNLVDGEQITLTLSGIPATQGVTFASVTSRSLVNVTPRVSSATAV